MSDVRAQNPLWIERLKVRPKASSPTDTVRSAPTLTARSKARPYFCVAGRSCSTP
jgi:hypothetical protein